MKFEAEGKIVIVGIHLELEPSMFGKAANLRLAYFPDEGPLCLRMLL